jgi:hypothetical protein
MALETATYISDLVSTNPTASDGKNQGDDHLRLLKSTIKTTFPNVAGAVTPTHVELNYVDGVTSSIQTQLDAKLSGTVTSLTSLTAVGTLVTGTWNASVIGAAYGGTGVANNAAATLTRSGNHGLTLTTTGTTSLTLPTAGTVAVDPGDHIVRVTTGNGHGSTNTKIRRWTTTEQNTGTAITYADSSTDGGAFTIATAGIYEVYYSEDKSSGGAYFGISVNSNQLTTTIYSITAAHRKAMAWQNVAGGNLTVTRVLKLAASDVVRAHTDGTPNDTDIADSVFSIRRIG